MEHKSITLNTTKGFLYSKIREYMENTKKKLFNELCSKKEIKAFIDSKVDFIYEQMQIHVMNGFNEDEAYEFIFDEIYFK